ncbi:hypothetical protein ACQCX2_09430 [Propionibacteriaceae bacterium Y1700]|uniref:hypothetical protein n=1 Tax=Microlunatus sp. Y1700 TaxID=3418487 RepID=UPI003DA7621A
MSAGDRAGRWGQRAAVALLTSCVLTLPAVSPAYADDVAFTIDDERITESSGLAADTCGNRYWTANDSGDKGTAYALSSKGKVQGTLTFPASPTDIEAVAVHDCKLYLADIGDNDKQRDMLTVYWFSDPEPGQQRSQYRSYDFAYPDGPHDAETFMVSESGQFFVVTKEAKGGIYRAPSQLSVQGVNELERVGDAPAYVTDGVMVDGDRMVLRTYVSVVVLDRGGKEVASTGIPIQQQGESISRTLDGKSLLLGTEGRPAPVLKIAQPKDKAEVPAGSSSPPPSDAQQSPTGAAEPSESQTEAADAGGERVLTWVALGIAGGLALLAAGVAFVLGGRRARGAHTEAGASAMAAPRSPEREPDPEPTDERGLFDSGTSDAVAAGDDAYDDEAQDWADDNDEADPYEDAEPSDSAAAVRPARAAEVPPAGPLIPDEEHEELDRTRGRIGARFESFFRPRRGHGPVQADEHEDLTFDDPTYDDRTARRAATPDVEEPEPPAAPPAARADLDPATRAWLDAAFDSSRGESRPRRARED